MRFAAMNGQAAGEPGAASDRRKAGALAAGRSAGPASGQLIETCTRRLMGLGHNPLEARNRLDSLLTSGKPFRNVQDAMTLIYSQKV